MYISHVTTFQTEIKLFQPMKNLLNYFRIISTTLNSWKSFMSCN